MTTPPETPDFADFRNPLEENRYKKLKELACAHVGPSLEKAELRVLRDSVSTVELPWPEEGCEKPVVRASFLRWLASDPEAAKFIDLLGLRVLGATIPEDLNLRGCVVFVELTCARCDFQGELNLQSARTRGLYFFDSSFAKGIRADRVAVEGPVFLRGIKAKGEIRLLGAKIGDNLDCVGAKLMAEVYALSADRAEIGGGVFLNGDFQSQGAIRFLGAEIRGNLDCSGAKFTAEGYVLSADGAKICGDVLLNGNFQGQGAIRFPGAEIRGNFDCTGAKFIAEGDALIADGAKICGGVYLGKGFQSQGALRFHGATIGGQLSVYEAKEIAVLNCYSATVGADFIWLAIGNSLRAKLGLTGAKIKNLRDDQASWPEEGNLNLDGLVYEELTLHEKPSKNDLENSIFPAEIPFDRKQVRQRVEWIKRQAPDNIREAQPWMQLRALLEKKGHRKEAKHVVYCYRKYQANQLEWHPLSWFASKLERIPYLRHPNRLWHIFFAWIEENPLRIGYTISISLVLGTLIFAGAERSKAMRSVCEKGAESKAAQPQPFQSFIYTLENAVPIIKLGMDDKWAPDPQHQPQPWYPDHGWTDGLKWLNSYWFLAISRWALIIFGWFQATIFAAAIAERFKR